MKRAKYSEPVDFIPESVRKELKLGEYAEDEETEANKKDENKDFRNMGDNKSFNHDRETDIIRNAIVKTGNKEALRLFDEEQKEMKKRAEEETAEMIKNGEIIEFAGE